MKRRMKKPIERVEKPSLGSFVLTPQGWFRVTRKGFVPWDKSQLSS